MPARTAFLPLFLVLTAVLRSASQEFTRTEIGFVTSILPENRFATSTDTGISARFTYNFTPSFALESEVIPYLTNMHTAGASLQFGGPVTAFLMGPKGGIRTRSFGVFFKARPGILSFSDTLTSAALFGDLATARKTHAVLDLGVVSEYYLSSRTVLRFDFGPLLVRYGDAPLFSSPAISVSSTGTIDSPWHIDVGIAYRPGSIESAEEQSSEPVERFESGLQYSLFTLERSLQAVRDESGIGGWFTWNFSRYFGLDSTVNLFPRQVKFADFQQGGRIFQAVAGVRAGIRRGHLGVYGKFRPGLQLYTLTTRNEQTQHLPSFADVAFDEGGIIELCTSHRTLLRFDAGNTVIHYRSRDVIDFEGMTLHVPGFTKNTIQLTAGFGFRF